MMEKNWLSLTWSILLAASALLGGPGQIAWCADPTNPDSVSFKYEEPKILAGTIYPKQGTREKPLFKFKRVATRSRSSLEVVREYNHPTGESVAKERIIYEKDDLVSYELEETQAGARGSAKIRQDPSNPAKRMIIFEYTKTRGAKPKTRTEAVREDVLVNDMVAPFLMSHWNALLKGEKVRCRCIAVARTETVGFTFVKESESKWQGREVIIIKMEPTSLIIAALVDPLIFVIEKRDPHRVLQYTGRTTPRIKTGNKWQDLDAVTVFDW